jgi:hypothetical protein
MNAQRRIILRARRSLGDVSDGGNANGGGNTITPDQLRDSSNLGPNNLTAPFDVTGDSTVVSVNSAQGQAITQELQAEARAGHAPISVFGTPGGIRLLATKPAATSSSSSSSSSNSSSFSLPAPLLQTYAGIPVWGWLAGGVVLLAVFS